MNWRVVCTFYFVSEGKIFAFQGLWTIWQHSKKHLSKFLFSWLREISLSQQAWQHVSGVYMLQGENNCMFRINSSQHSLPWILLNKLLQLSFRKNVTDTNIVSLFQQIPCFCFWYASILHKTKKQKHWLGPLASRCSGFTWALLINCSWFPWWLWHSRCFMFHGKLLMDSLMTMTFMVFHVSWQTPLIQLLYLHFSHKWLENIRTITALGRKISSFKALCVCVEEWNSAFTSDLTENLFWGCK